MNPLITKAIEMLPKEMEQTKEESDTEWFLAYGYNQALNDCKQSLPLIFKMIREELEKIKQEYQVNPCNEPIVYVDYERLLPLLTIEKK